MTNIYQTVDFGVTFLTVLLQQKSNIAISVYLIYRFTEYINWYSLHKSSLENYLIPLDQKLSRKLVNLEGFIISASSAWDYAGLMCNFYRDAGPNGCH